METKEKVSVFEYRRRKAEAEMKKCAAQQKIVDLLLEAGFRRAYAEEVAEHYHGGEEITTINDEPELTRQVNKLLKRVHDLQNQVYQIEQNTTLY